MQSMCKKKDVKQQAAQLLKKKKTRRDMKTNQRTKKWEEKILENENATYTESASI